MKAKKKKKSHWPEKSLFAPVTLSYIHFGSHKTPDNATVSVAFWPSSADRHLTFHSLCWKLHQIYFRVVSYFRRRALELSVCRHRHEPIPQRKNTIACAVLSLCVCIYSSIKQTMWYIPEGHRKKHLCRVMDWGKSPQKCCNSLFVCPDVECPQTFFFSTSHYLLRTLQQPRLSC